jgi:hypothetical protein
LGIAALEDKSFNAALLAILPILRDVLRAILRELGGHSNTGQRESANASYQFRDRIGVWVDRGGPAGAGLLNPLAIAAVSSVLKPRQSCEARQAFARL